jgi:hypothetical protein
LDKNLWLGKLMTEIQHSFEALGVIVELAALFVLCALGSSVFDKFEAETAAWKKFARWGIAATLTLSAYTMVGHWALLVLFGFAGLGVAVHYQWCKKHGIDSITAQPRERYYHLRGWDWPPR